MAVTRQDIIINYQAILRRDPEPRELRFWSGPASARRTRADLASALLLQATEVRSIARLYAGLLGRLPEGLNFLPRKNDDGLTYWTGLLRQYRSKNRSLDYRTCLTHCIVDWFANPEHCRLYDANLCLEDFTDRLCLALTGRRPAVEDEWARSDGQAGKAEIAVAIAESAACKDHFNEKINSSLLAAVEIARDSCYREGTMP